MDLTRLSGVGASQLRVAPRDEIKDSVDLLLRQNRQREAQAAFHKASELNPDIREEICGRFVEDYAEEPVVDEEDVERSEYECLLGIPLFVH